MYIKIRGKPVNISTSMSLAAVKFYGQYLLGDRLSKNVTILVEYSKFKKGSDDYAFCDYDNEDSRPRNFNIIVSNNLSQKESLLALAHEMVHVKQYAKGEMKDLFRPARMVKWKGEKYSHEDIEDYWEQPWEIEAYGREKGLYIKFISHMKTNNLWHDK